MAVVVFIASQNMVNAFKTDVNGLPLFDTFNDSDILKQLMLMVMLR
jgi:hypothetical protein